MNIENEHNVSISMLSANVLAVFVMLSSVILQVVKGSMNFQNIYTKPPGGFSR